MAEALPVPRTIPEPAPTPRRRSRLRRIVIALGLILGVLLVAAIAGALWFRGQLRASLPQMEGERALPGLSAPVTVERDSLGVPTIQAKDRIDAARAMGFLHAQERFFQMDLMRRQAAGELSEVFGKIAVEVDQALRVHRLRDVAQRTVAAATPRERAILAAYTGGVNAGLAALGAPPFEYLLLRQDPAPWKEEDSVLVPLAMFIELQQPNGVRELSLGIMHDLLPPALFDFLTPAGTEWDAPLVGEPRADLPVPGPEVFDLRREKVSPKPLPWRGFAERHARGSNNWAVAGTHTADGRGWLANDMHLGIAVPNTWYRASIALPERRITGVTLPGVPAFAVASTGLIAWGFTNSYIDWHDLVIVETDPKDPEIYRTPQGLRRFERHREVIRVKDGEDTILEVRSTVWGPVLFERDHRGRALAFSWMAHHPDAVNFALLDLESAQNVDEAVAIAHRAGLPPQNFVVADAEGRIAWTIIGKVPKRIGFDGKVPTSWADGSRRWDGWLAAEEVPQIVDPPGGRIWTANNRLIEGPELARIGDSGFWLGARARQIRDGLLALDKAGPQDLLAIQLDDRALFLERWRKLLLDTLQSSEGRRAEMRNLVEQSWTGRASVDSVGHRFVKEFRQEVRNQVFEAIAARCAAAEERFDMGEIRQIEGPLWKLVSERPAHLLDRRYKTWDELLLSAADAVLSSYGDEPLAERTWGERNTTRIRHPLSGALPGFAARWLNMPPRPMPGDVDMPRLQGPSFGSSERIVVSPGKEEAGYFHMPVGQSGHPLSPHYRDGHSAWEEGKPTPFLPGKAVHTLKLMP
ncbi:MAG TPA: penicillin acylase family protein [Thermoanaerobaculia bacterium]|nr:penicillin acylase family protein [Thermoanaerobaculia bacterium]